MLGVKESHKDALGEPEGVGVGERERERRGEGEGEGVEPFWGEAVPLH